MTKCAREHGLTFIARHAILTPFELSASSAGFSLDIEGVLALIPDARPRKAEIRRAQAPVASDDVGQGVHDKWHPQPPGPIVGGHHIGQVRQ